MRKHGGSEEALLRLGDIDARIDELEHLDARHGQLAAEAEGANRKRADLGERLAVERRRPSLPWSRWCRRSLRSWGCPRHG